MMNIGKTMRRAALASVALALAVPALAAWEPTKPVEFVIPAGTGGGADQMARLIQGIIVKHKLMKESMIVVNKAGGAGAEGFLSVKEAKGDPHKLIITLSNLFTTPLATGVPFNWKDMTPVSMMALDQFVLWVNASTPYKNANEFIAAVKAAGPNKMKMGGTGSKQEDQILTVGLEKATGTKFIYVPYKGGGEVAVQLVGGHIDATVNNPIEAVAQWRAGTLRPLVRVRRRAHAVQDQGHRQGVVVRHPDLQGGRRADRLRDAARRVHGAGRHGRADRLLRRSSEEGARDARLEGIHGKGCLQHHRHERHRLRQVALGC